MEKMKKGTVATYSDVYEPLKPLSVSPAVWDEVLDEMFAEPFPQLPIPFQELLFELEVGKKALSDYPRTEGASDHDYVRDILKQLKLRVKPRAWYTPS